MDRTQFVGAGMIGIGLLVAGGLSARDPHATAEPVELQRAFFSAAVGSIDARYHGRSEKSQVVLESPPQALSLATDGERVRIESTGGALEMRLVSWGCGAVQLVQPAASPRIETNRVTLARNSRFEEWFIAGPAGVEQGFTVGGPAPGCEGAGELVILLELDRPAALAAGGRSLEFPNLGLMYRGLFAVDAGGEELAAGFTVDGRRVVIRTTVDDAQWPVTVDPMFETAKLLASDASVQFGYSVAISGDTIVVGDPFEGSMNSGAVYVFATPGGAWFGSLTQSAKLVASTRDSSDQFGISVGVSGDTVVAGAYKQDTTNGIQSGAAFVYERPPGDWSGTLTESAVLLPSDGNTADWAGSGVAIDGSVVVVGAYGAYNSSIRTGAAYVFEEPMGGWSGTVQESAKLLASDGGMLDYFSYFPQGVAVSGDTIVIGAFGDDDLGNDSGAAYVFEEPGGGWSGTILESAKLLPSDGEGGDQFGFAVAVSGNTVVAGAPRFDGVSAVASGAAYVFVEPAGGWSGTLNEDSRLLPSDPEGTGSFGTSVAVLDETIGIGKFTTRPLGPGVAYRFLRPDGGWAGVLNETDRFLASDRQPGDLLGFSVALGDSVMVVGARGDDGMGSAYVFPGGSTLFADSFEPGDTSAWSSAVP